MSLSLNKPKLDNLANEIWKSAERLRGKFKAYEYQNVVLPIIVIRRLECVLLKWREEKRAEIHARQSKLSDQEIDALVKKLEQNPQQSPFSNKTDWTLRRVYEEDHALLEENFRAYINGFSKNVDDIIENFNYRAVIGQMVKNNRLAPILNQYKELELGPEKLSPLEMGYIYEELLRRFSDHGQEMSPTNYAICRADLLIKDDRHARVHLGNSLIPHEPHSREPGDQLPEGKFHFDFMLSNPPFGVTWGGKDGYEAEARKLKTTRYRAGMPRVNDGALLFLQTMLAKMKASEKGASRIAIIFNGSPLSNGDCGSGESEIRRWILENDWLDAIVMLPDQLFYNTGIFTYIWLLRNDKPASHKGRVMLIDARKQFEKEPKSFGNKRHRITDSHREWIAARYRNGWNNGYRDEDVKLFHTTEFAFHKVSVVFWQTDENDRPAMVTEQYEKAFTAANIKKEQEFYASELNFTIALTEPKSGRKATVHFTLGHEENFTKIFEQAVKKAFKTEPAELAKGIDDTKGKSKAFKGFLASLQTEVEWTHRHYVKDDEYIPYGEDIETFLNREIAKPIIRWQDSPQLGYEILPNKYFYRYQPPTPADELLAEFWRLEKEAETLLKGLAQ